MYKKVGNFIADGLQMVQQEIEFLPTDVTRAADEMALAKWVVRRVVHSHGIEGSLARIRSMSDIRSRSVFSSGSPSRKSAQRRAENTADALAPAARCRQLSVLRDRKSVV